MKRKTKQFFSAVLAACILGAASMPVSATGATKSSPANDQFYEQVQNVISDYWQDDYGTEIRFTAGQTGAQVDGKTVGHEIGCEVTEDGDFLISAETFADVTGEALLCKEENPEASDFQTMCLTVRSQEMPIVGSEYGAVQTIEDSSGLYILQFDSVQDTKAAYESLSAVSGVIVEEDQVISLEEVSAETDTQAFTYRSWGAKRIGADQWIENMTPEQKQQEVVVAVLDTGVSSSHADFREKLLDGISMLDKDYTFDQHSHGTHVAGTVVDLTQGTNVKILPVQVLDPVTGKGTTLSAGSGVQWASQHGADVINMSLTAKTGVASDSHYLDRAVNQAVANQVVVVAAAGNDAADTAPYCPAHIPELLCVSAVDSKDQLAYFSNYGSAMDLAAPGVSIQSAVPGGYGYKSGTSMAAPHVAAAAALLKTALPDATSQKNWQSVDGKQRRSWGCWLG